MDHLSLASAWQVEAAHEDVARVTVARIVASRIAIPLGPARVVAITRVGSRLLVASARATAEVRPRIVVTIAMTLSAVAGILVAVARVVGPASIAKHRHLRRHGLDGRPAG
jgi:uncharacterized protein YqfA (UPF0365 family)